jgi:hypothetical protein
MSIARIHGLPEGKIAALGGTFSKVLGLAGLLDPRSGDANIGNVAPQAEGTPPTGPLYRRRDDLLECLEMRATGTELTIRKGIVGGSIWK